MPVPATTAPSAGVSVASSFSSAYAVGLQKMRSYEGVGRLDHQTRPSDRAPTTHWMVVQRAGVYCSQ